MTARNNYATNHHRADRGIRGATRSTGTEIRALVWLIRHPAFVLVPVLGIWAVALWGTTAVLSGLGGALAGFLIWWRAHPSTYDRWIAPGVRTVWRRWTAYRGRRWRGVLTDCELTRENRRTGHVLCPRVLRVRSVTPSIDTLAVRIVRGQDPAVFTEKLPALADALGAHRVAVTRARPGVLSMVVERRMPFPHVIDAAPIPASSADSTCARSTSATTSAGSRSPSACGASTCSSSAPPARARAH